MFFSSNVLGCYTYKIESPYYVRGLCSQSLAVTRQRRRFSSVSSQTLLNMVLISRNSLWFIFHLIASLPCRPTPCRRRGRMRRPTASKIPALLKRQAARRRAMRYRQFRELAVLSLSLTSLLTTLPRYTRFKLRFTECICYYGPYPYAYGYATSWGVCAKLLQLIE